MVAAKMIAATTHHSMGAREPALRKYYGAQLAASAGGPRRQPPNIRDPGKAVGAAALGHAQFKRK